MNRVATLSVSAANTYVTGHCEYKSPEFRSVAHLLVACRKPAKCPRCVWAGFPIGVTHQIFNINPAIYARMQAYLQDVVGKGQLLDIINLVGKDTDFLKNFDPKNPPKSIPAQQPTPNLRGPIAIKIAPPPANDPRFVVHLPCMHISLSVGKFVK